MNLSSRWALVLVLGAALTACGSSNDAGTSTIGSSGSSTGIGPGGGGATSATTAGSTSGSSGSTGASGSSTTATIGGTLGGTTGASGTSGTSATSGTSGSSGPCPALLGPIHAGATWTYSYSDSNGTHSATRHLEQVTPTGTGVELVFTWTYDPVTGTGYTYTSTAEQHVSCDASGATMSEFYSSYTVDQNGTRSSGWSDSTYSPPWLLYPASGTSWSFSSTLQSTSSSGTSTSSAYSCSLVASPGPAVTVSPGTYNTTRVDSNCNGTSSWEEDAPEVGMVTSSFYTLTSYQP